MRILLVDDDAVFRDELSSLLQDDGHHVVAIPSVLKAVEALEQDGYDVLFTDLKMPRHGGMELLSTARHRWPSMQVVVVTGFATVQTAVEAMKVGAFDYISKPFRMEQIRKVLELAQQEREFSGQSSPERDPAQVARTFAEKGGLPVLLITEKAVRPPTGVEVFALDPENLNHSRDVLESYLTSHPRSAFVLTGIDRLFERHQLPEVLDVLRGFRDLMKSHGPFAVGFDASRVTEAQAEAVRGVVASPAVHGALEALASPIRRRILRRVAEGPATFSEAMHAAGIDDSPKMSFHMHRLLDEGLVARKDEDYRITPKGEGAVAVLHEMEKVAAGGQDGNVVFQESHR